MEARDELAEAAEEAAAAQDPDAIDDVPEEDDADAEFAVDDRGGDEDASAGVENADRIDLADSVLGAQRDSVLDELRSSEDDAMSLEELSEATGMPEDELREMLDALRDEDRVVEMDPDVFAVRDEQRRDDTETLARTVSEPEGPEEEAEADPDDREEPGLAEAEQRRARAAGDGGPLVRALVVVELAFPMPADATDADILASAKAFAGDAAKAAQPYEGSARTQVVKVQAYDTPREVALS